MNIYKFKNYNKLLFSPWSVVAPVRYKRVLYCKENSSYPSLCWKWSFFSFSKHSWKATCSSPTVGEVWLSHQPHSPLICSCQSTFKMWFLLPWKFLSAEPFSVLAQGGDSPASLEVTNCTSHPCRYIHFPSILAARSDFLADSKEGLQRMVGISLNGQCPSPLHCHGNEGQEQGSEMWWGIEGSIHAPLSTHNKYLQ